MIERPTIAECAMSWIGAPALHQGRSRDGIDCAGLMVCVGAESGAGSYDITGYNEYPSSEVFYRFLDQSPLIQKDIPNRMIGDIITLRIAREVRHLAILVDADKMVHVCAKARRVVLRGFGENTLRIVDRCYQYPNVRD